MLSPRVLVLTGLLLGASAFATSGCAHGAAQGTEVRGEGAQPAPYAVPPLERRVNDLAGKLSRAQQTSMEQELEGFERDTTIEIVVLILPSLDGHTIEDVALRTFNTWKLGKRDANNGVLFLVAVAEHKVRIETGLGVEKVLTDRRAKEILQTRVSPRFREGDFAGGVLAGVRDIESTLFTH